MSIYLISKQ